MAKSPDTEKKADEALKADKAKSSLPPKENQPKPKAEPWKIDEPWDEYPKDKVIHAQAPKPMAGPTGPTGATGATGPVSQLTPAELDRVKRGQPAASGLTGQMPGPEPVAPAEPEPPAPKPVKHAAPKEVAPGIVHIAHKKIYHVELKVDGKVLNVGNFDTLEAAQKAQTKAKADYDM